MKVSRGIFWFIRTIFINYVICWLDFVFICIHWCDMIIIMKEWHVKVNGNSCYKPVCESSVAASWLPAVHCMIRFAFKLCMCVRLQSTYPVGSSGFRASVSIFVILSKSRCVTHRVFHAPHQWASASVPLDVVWKLYYLGTVSVDGGCDKAHAQREKKQKKKKTQSNNPDRPIPQPRALWEMSSCWPYW